MRSLDELEPGVLYALEAARQFVPGYKTRPLSRRRLYAHIAAGKLRVVRPGPGRRLAVWGADLLAYLDVGAPPVVVSARPASPDKVRFDLRAMGFVV